jgi:hypothetical protein
MATHPDWCRCKDCRRDDREQERAALGKQPDPAVEAEFESMPDRIPEEDDGRDHYDPRDELCLAIVSPSRSTREEDPYEGIHSRYDDPEPGRDRA